MADNKYNLFQKLTLLGKTGMRRNVDIKSKPQDAKVDPETKKKLESQVERATTDFYTRITQINPDMYAGFRDFESMEYMTEISSALDIYADESTTKNEEGAILKISSENEDIKKHLETLLIDTLSINNNLWTWIRNTCKFGNWYLFFDVQEERGITGFMPLPVAEILREEAYDGNLNSVKFTWTNQNLPFDSWQVGHFRLITDEVRYPYGTSILECCRRIWKQLQLAEDAMLVYRATRAPERRVFYVDVGNIDPKDVPEYVKMIADKTKRRTITESETGNMKYTFNPMSYDEDYWIPRRNEKTAQIETLPGASNLSEISDVQYFQNKLFAGLKIPKAFLTYESDLNAKSTLSSQDSRFARTINRVQQAVLNELKRICIIHLYSIGFRKIEDLLSFDLHLSSPNKQLELEQLELLAKKGEVFRALWDPQTTSPITWSWGMKYIMGFTNDQIISMVKQKYAEGLINAQIEDVSTPGFEKTGTTSGGTAPAQSSGGKHAFDTYSEGYKAFVASVEKFLETGFGSEKVNVDDVTSFITEEMDEIDSKTKMSTINFAKSLIAEKKKFESNNDTKIIKAINARKKEHVETK